ncbi:MAG TPA: hypothetical protein VKY19_20935 [Ktedonosporobacter sp.]|jgi:uncharacterized membrane protein|nr:hypothetical protein [Ktedonosporobacter sp.]
MLSRLNYFMTQLVISIRWSYWLVIAAVLIAVVAPMVLHLFAGLPVIHLVAGPLDPHPQG